MSRADRRGGGGTAGLLGGVAGAEPRGPLGDPLGEGAHGAAVGVVDSDGAGVRHQWRAPEFWLGPGVSPRAVVFLGWGY